MVLGQISPLTSKKSEMSLTGVIYAHLHGRDGGQDEEPEPHGDEDFLVEDVLRQHTQVVHLVEFPACRVVPEVTLGHSGEGGDEGSGADFRRHHLEKRGR